MEEEGGRRRGRKERERKRRERRKEKKGSEGGEPGEKRERGDLMTRSKKLKKAQQQQQQQQQQHSSFIHSGSSGGGVIGYFEHTATKDGRAEAIEAPWRGGVPATFVRPKLEPPAAFLLAGPSGPPVAQQPAPSAKAAPPSMLACAPPPPAASAAASAALAVPAPAVPLPSPPSAQLYAQIKASVTGRYYATSTVEATLRCYRCKELGHFAAQCTAGASGRLGGGCHVCGDPSHGEGECPSEACFVCDEPGHRSGACPNRAGMMNSIIQYGRAVGYGRTLSSDMGAADAVRAVMRGSTRDSTAFTRALASRKLPAADGLGVNFCAVCGGDLLVCASAQASLASAASAHAKICPGLKDLSRVTCSVCGKRGHAFCSSLGGGGQGGAEAPSSSCSLKLPASIAMHNSVLPPGVTMGLPLGDSWGEGEEEEEEGEGGRGGRGSSSSSAFFSGGGRDLKLGQCFNCGGGHWGWECPRGRQSTLSTLFFGGASYSGPPSDYAGGRYGQRPPDRERGGGEDDALLLRLQEQQQQHQVVKRGRGREVEVGGGAGDSRGGAKRSRHTEEGEDSEESEDSGDSSASSGGEGREWSYGADPQGRRERVMSQRKRDKRRRREESRADGQLEGQRWGGGHHSGGGGRQHQQQPQRVVFQMGEGGRRFEARSFR